MNPINLLLLVCFLSFSKQGVSSEQNFERFNNSRYTSTENITSVSNLTTEKSVKIKEYMADDPIELYDLINLLLPDESVNTRDFNFDKLDELGIVFMFDGHEENWKTATENVFGILDITFNGIREVDEWSISIDKDRSKFNLGKSTPAYSFPYDEYKGTALEYLFPGKDYSFEILEKKSLENPTRTYELYEIKFPGKKTFWIAERFDSGTHQGNYYLFFYLNKNEVKKDF